MTEPQTFQVINQQANTSVIDCLFENTPLSKQKLKQALTCGAVWLQNSYGTNRVRKAKKTLNTGDTLFVYYNESLLQTLPPTPTLIEDNQNFSIWHKPYGMFCQGSKWGDHCTINRWVEKHLQRPAFIVHRLDRATTGLIIIAHSKTMAQYFSNLFQQRQVAKHYRAKVVGKYPDKPQTYHSDVNQQSALTIVNLLAYDALNNISHLNVEIKTGRKHQIRIHLSENNFSIIGDRLYGSDKLDVDLQLCCYSLAFNNPNTNEKVLYNNLKCG